MLRNASRLLKDGKLLSDHERHASAFVLATLALEEVGKVILSRWASPEPLPKRTRPVSFHVQKQAAVAHLVAAELVLIRSREMGPAFFDYDKALARIAKTYAEEEAGRFVSHVQIGAVEKAKHLGLYREEAFDTMSLHIEVFSADDFAAQAGRVRKALSLLSDAKVLTVGRATYVSSICRKEGA